MSFPVGPPFNPHVSKIPILDSSSGNPKAYKDPNSTASLGKKLQAMTDQASADTLYDTPPKKVEGFRNELYNPWILKTESCSKKEGFRTSLEYSSFEPKSSNLGILLLLFSGLTALILSFSKKSKK
jgi:hypothetical protein